MTRNTTGWYQQTNLCIRHSLFFEIILLLISIGLLLLPNPASSDPSYYDNSKEGWLWYQEPPEEEIEEENEQNKEPIVPEHSPPTNFSMQQLMDMHPDEFSKHYTEVLKY